MILLFAADNIIGVKIIPNSDRLQISVPNADFSLSLDSQIDFTRDGFCLNYTNLGIMGLATCIGNTFKTHTQNIADKQTETKSLILHLKTDVAAQQKILQEMVTTELANTKEKIKDELDSAKTALLASQNEVMAKQDEMHKELAAQIDDFAKKEIDVLKQQNKALEARLEQAEALIQQLMQRIPQQ